jgi:glycosyltransferase involved in cell wall biosynthesis
MISSQELTLGTVRRALFVAFTVPENAERSSSGFHRRQRLLIDAIKLASSEIEVLLYVQPGPDATTEAKRCEIEKRLNAIWEGKFEVTLCVREEPLVGGAFWQRYIRPALSFFSQPGYGSFSRPTQVDALNACLERQPDFVFVHRLLCTPPVLLTRKKLPPVFLDMDDIEHVAFARSIPQPPVWASKRLEYLQVPALMYGERLAIRRCEGTFVCSEIDRKKLQQLSSTDKVIAVPNAVAMHTNGLALTSSLTLLLLGDYSYAPNRLGAEFFIDKVWPRVIATVPGASITIAGLRSELISQSVAPPEGIDFPGFVTDLDAAYAGARIVVCPILSGGGTRVKVMEAAAYGKPIVATTIGAEGIDLANNIEIVLRDSPEAFAEACITLLQDYHKAAETGMRAAQAIEARYERSRVVTELARVLSRSSEESNS